MFPCGRSLCFINFSSFNRNNIVLTIKYFYTDEAISLFYIRFSQKLLGFKKLKFKKKEIKVLKTVIKLFMNKCLLVFLKFHNTNFKYVYMSNYYLSY